MKAQFLSNRYVLAGATLAVALGIGFFMQRGNPYPLSGVTPGAEAPDLQAAAVAGAGQPQDSPGGMLGEGPALSAPPPVGEPLTEIDFTSASVAPHRTPGPHPLSEPPLRDASTEIQGVRADGSALEDAAADRMPRAPASSCDVAMAAEPRPNALVRLKLDAPCLPGERLTLHHNGLTFTAVTDEEGTVAVDVPALSSSAVFIAAFPNGDGAVVQASVPGAEVRDRVVLQWRGAAGLQLHVFEGEAGYGTDGHLWAEAPGDIAAESAAGFLVRLGDPDAAEPLMAEIYTFPAEMPSAGVSMTVEAEVTASNCGRELSARTMGVMDGTPAERHELTFFMPDCAAVGDFLVLKNLYEDLKIASR
jgi:hypothetical protein